MSPTPTPGKLAAWGFPRMSGDEPAQMALDLWRKKFSPRERG